MTHLILGPPVSNELWERAIQAQQRRPERRKESRELTAQDLRNAWRALRMLAITEEDAIKLCDKLND